MINWEIEFIHVVHELEAVPQYKFILKIFKFKNIQKYFDIQTKGEIDRRNPGRFLS